MNTRILFFLAAIAFSFIFGWKLRDWKAVAESDALASAGLKAKEQMEQLANTFSAKTEAAIQNIRVENRTIYQRTQREITEKPVYRDCVLPDDGLRLVNAVRAGSAGKSDNSLPATSTNSVER